MHKVRTYTPRYYRKWTLMSLSSEHLLLKKVFHVRVQTRLYIQNSVICFFFIIMYLTF